MVRMLTALIVLFLVACGGGSGGGAEPSPELAALFPIAAQDSGDEFIYSIEKTHTDSSGSDVRQFMRTFFLGRAVDPTGPDLHTVSSSKDPGVGAGLMWTDRGLELIAYGSMQLAGAGGICVTATSPGLLLVPAGFQPGDSHTCSIPGLVDESITTWVGSEPVSGHPTAERFDMIVTGPCESSSTFCDRFDATSYEIMGTAYLVPGIGPVSGFVTIKTRPGPRYTPVTSQYVSPVP